tara:strand:+ start:369 stop:1523 length:1155 start_codon:yes stop_codon:yes gene_type:complete
MALRTYIDPRAVIGGKKSIEQSYSSETYLSGLPHGQYITDNSFGNFGKFIQGFKKEISKLNLFHREEKKHTEPGWVKCKNGCYKIVKKALEKEMKSTAYILRCLSKSMINSKLVISCSDINAITGVWKEDHSLFTIGNFSGQSRGKLIMGFGPSASGKTYWAKNIINILSEMDTHFPRNFITIDGDVYRKSSVIYQILVEYTIHQNIGGVANLVSAGFGRSSLFPASEIKKTIQQYLSTQDPSNLYIPSTLGGCVHGLSTKGFCVNLYAKYKKITNDINWVGLCIWQHVDDTKCIFSPMYKCTGCRESGQRRERTNGKKYSSVAWKYSYDSGMEQAKKANKWFIIHNTGGRVNDGVSCINLIESSEAISTDIQQKYNCEVHKFN